MINHIVKEEARDDIDPSALTGASIPRLAKLKRSIGFLSLESSDGLRPMALRRRACHTT